MKEVGTGEATGKIILMGEHAVVYQKPAIAFPFKGTTITAMITQANENTLTSSYHTGSLKQTSENLANITQLTQKLQKDLHTPAFHLTIQSTIPAERGMGSSAAVAVAITRAFFDWQQLELSEESLLTYVNFSEQIAHGNPSGIDAAATSGSQPIYYRKNQAILPFPLDLDAFLVVADTGIKGQTRASVRSVAELAKVQPKLVTELTEHLGLLTDQAKEAIMHNEATLLGELMDQAQLDLEKLGVSNQELTDYTRLAKQYGALGAKLTGGGRGGCFIVLTKTKEQAETICRILQEAGVKGTWLQGLGAYQHA
ncbi:mevalonate kinase [Enterococcus bulliens]